MSLGGPPEYRCDPDIATTITNILGRMSQKLSYRPAKAGNHRVSQGGVMAYSLALAHSERFAALAVLSSWLPKEMLPRLDINPAVQSLPTLVQHGTEDQDHRSRAREKLGGDAAPIEGAANLS